CSAWDSSLSSHLV
nr:immunoglobulin light chain junction region [Macaca mulatta]